MSWRAEYGLLLLLSTIIDYYCGLQIEKYRLHKGIQKRLLYFSLTANLSLLFFFKYLDFLGENYNRLSEWMGWEYSWTTLNILLPIGISFYTFQTISYTIDVYRGHIPAEKDFATFALFVSFFPQLVAGPIERAGHLLPQINRQKNISADKIIFGLKIMAYGFFKKMVVADNLAPFVDRVYDPAYQGSATEYLLATYAFMFQVYGDFSGYSDIALGTAAIIGFQLSPNFRQPYFATSVADFWRRWHISLSAWFRDYVYIPLGGNRKSEIRTYFNLTITMIVAGAWHGAAWHFILFGLISAVSMIIERPFKRSNIFRKIYLPGRFLYCLQVFFVFHIICISFVFLRAASVQQAIHALLTILQNTGDIFPLQLPSHFPYIGFAFTVILLGFDLIEEKYGDYTLAVMAKIPVAVRYLMYSALIFSVLLFGVYKSSQFIYFQF